MLDPNTEFGALLQQAAQIKGKQCENKRRLFEKSPCFLKQSLFNGEKEECKQERLLPFAERMEVLIEDNGNRELTLNGASDGFKDKLGEELELDGASDTGNGKRSKIVSVFHTDTARSLDGHFLR